MDAFEAFADASDRLFATLRSTRGQISATAGLSSSQARLMEPLAAGAPVAVSALAREAGVAVPTATRMLQALEHNGMVSRRRSALSERVVEVTLTERGADALDGQLALLRDRQRRTFDALTPQEQATSLPLIEKLITLARGL